MQTKVENLTTIVKQNNRNKTQPQMYCKGQSDAYPQTTTKTKQKQQKTKHQQTKPLAEPQIIESQNHSQTLLYTSQVSFNVPPAKALPKSTADVPRCRLFDVGVWFLFAVQVTGVEVRGKSQTLVHLEFLSIELQNQAFFPAGMP